MNVVGVRWAIQAPLLVQWLVVADKPPVTDRTVLCDGRCLLDDITKPTLWLDFRCRLSSYNSHFLNKSFANLK
jgi:hypothetical protein